MNESTHFRTYIEEKGFCSIIIAFERLNTLHWLTSMRTIYSFIYINMYIYVFLNKDIIYCQLCYHDFKHKYFFHRIQWWIRLHGHYKSLEAFKWISIKKNKTKKKRNKRKYLIFFYYNYPTVSNIKILHPA